MGSLLAEVQIPMLFNSIQGPVTVGPSEYISDNVYYHYCWHCRHTFTSKWGYSNFCGWTRWDGANYRCPKCGEKAEHRGFAHDVSEKLPETMTLKLYEYTHHITLMISYSEIGFDPEDFSIVSARRYETVKFDLKNKKTFFRSKEGERYEISNPDRVEFYGRSALRYLTPNCAAWSTNKKDFANLLLKLRTAITKKAKALHGTKLGALYVPAGKHYGALTFPLQNLAWRVAVNDAPNLPARFNDRSWQGRFKSYLSTYHMVCVDLAPLFDKVLAETRKGLSYPQSVLKAAGIEDRKAFRRIIAQGELLEIGRLKTALFISKSYTEQQLLVEALANTGEMGSPIELSYAFDEKELAFLKLISENYENNAAYHMIKSCKPADIADCRRMYMNLIPATRELLWAEKPALSRIHDWLVEKYVTQQDADYTLDIPEHVIKRFAMQRDRLKFFLPETSDQLKEIGKKMHNCVGSYAEKVLNGTCAITAMTDDEGKLLVCIEIQDGAIKQAKLNQNQPVCRNEKLNAAVLDWAKAAELKIETNDINLIIKRDESDLRAVI